MLEFEFVLVSAHLVKVVHVQLNQSMSTCRMKEDMFECLKYWGRTISSKAFMLKILNELHRNSDVSDALGDDRCALATLGEDVIGGTESLQAIILSYFFYWSIL